jgi:serine/threonine protein kinase
VNATDPFGLVGQVLDGQFRVDELVGEGGFSAVYRGHHAGLNEPIAIKCLKLPAALGTSVVDTFVQRFRDESRILYRLSQGNLHIVRSIAAGTTTSRHGVLVPYMVLEWLEGKSVAHDLADRRERGEKGRPIEALVPLFASAADALAFAHAQGIVHRDLNPGNLFLCKTSSGTKMKVLDFGVAKVMHDSTLGLGPRAQTVGHIRVFAPAYGAPEQFGDDLGPVGPPSDVYSFALIFLEALRDHPVNEGAHLGELAQAAVDPEKRPTPRSLGIEVTDPVEAVFARATKLDPRERWSTAGEMWQALVAAVSAKPKMTSRTLAFGVSPASPSVPRVPLPGAPRVPLPSSSRVPLPSSPRVPLPSGGRSGSQPGDAPATQRYSSPRASDPDLLTAASGPPSVADEAEDEEEATRVRQPDEDVLRSIAMYDASADDEVSREDETCVAPGPPVSSSRQPSSEERLEEPGYDASDGTLMMPPGRAANPAGSAGQSGPGGAGALPALTSTLAFGAPNPGFSPPDPQPMQAHGKPANVFGGPTADAFPPAPPGFSPQDGSPPQANPPSPSGGHPIYGAYPAPPQQVQPMQQGHVQQGHVPQGHMQQGPPPQYGGYGHPEAGAAAGYGAPMPHGAAVEAAPAETRGKPPVLAIVAAIALLVLGVVGIALFWVSSRAPESPPEAVVATEVEPVPAPVDEPPPPPPPIATEAPLPEAPVAAEEPPPAAEPEPEPEPAEEPARAAPTPPAAAPVATARPAAAPVATARPAAPTPTANEAVDPRAWNESAARSRLAQANGVLAFCKRDGTVSGPGTADVTFSPDGTVSTVTLEKPYAGTKEGECVAGQFRRAKISAFDGGPRSVKHSFAVPK